jgi:anti-sigma regulatory factor (Ser/Thr protein kinase)
MKKLIVEAHVDNLDQVVDFINEDLEEHNCPPNLQSAIDITVEEIFVNIANYAYKPENGNVTICISTKEGFVISFEDTGKPYNPLERADPDFSIPINERKPGGLGIFLVKQLMDKVTYTRVDNKNLLTMTKEMRRQGIGNRG